MLAIRGRRPRGHGREGEKRLLSFSRGSRLRRGENCPKIRERHAGCDIGARGARAVAGKSTLLVAFDPLDLRPAGKEECRQRGTLARGGIIVAARF